MRSASTTLCRNLALHPDITNENELLNPYEQHDVIRDLGYRSHHAVMADLPNFTRRLARNCPTPFCVLKVFQDHVIPPGELKQFFAWSDVPVDMIVLSRQNVTAQWQSYRKAAETGNWGTTPCEQRTGTAVYVNRTAKTLETFSAELSDWFSSVRSLVAHGPQLELSMENLMTSPDDVMRSAYRHIGLEQSASQPLTAPECFSH
jgi:LPS sulfotransferase NodH